MLALIMLGLLFVAPFLLPMHRLPQPAFDAEWLAAILLAGAAIVLGTSRRRTVLVQWPLPAWLAAMLAIVALQYVTDRLHYSSQLVLACIYGFAVAGAYLVGRAVLATGQRDRAIKAIAWALVIGAILSVLIQFLQLADVKGLPSWLYFQILDPWFRTRPVANVGQVNLLATYFIWALCGVLLLLRGSLRPTLALCFIFVIAAGLALTRSRLGLVFSVGVVAALWIPSGLRPENRTARISMTAALMLGYLAGSGIVGLFVAYQGAGVDNALERFGEAGGFSVRLVMWRDALRVAATAPLIGVGFGDYAAHQYWIAVPGAGGATTTYVHNIVLQTAAELGWPLAFLLTTGGGWWAAAQCKERLADKQTAFAWAFVFFIGIHSLVEWPLASMHFLLPAALLFAMAEPRLKGTRAAAALDSRLLVIVGVAGVLLALPMKLEFDELADVSNRVEVARHSKQGIDESTVMRMLALGDTARLRIYADRLLVLIRPPAIVEATDLEIERHERLLIGGADSRLIARLVILYAKAGRMDESVRNAKRLGIFADADYAEISKMILQAVEPLGAAADPLRKQLADGAVAAR